jgi:DNA-binding transcriptional ArsR family regulator
MTTAHRATVVLPGGWWLRTRGELGAALPNVAARIPARQLRITAVLYNLWVMMRNDPLSRAFAALADPTRRAILERLAAGEAGVVELAEESTLTQPAITKHLKVLEAAGLISRARVGRRRPARLQLDGLLPVDDWLRRAHADWSDRLDRLEAHLATQAETTTMEESDHA